MLKIRSTSSVFPGCSTQDRAVRIRDIGREPPAPQLLAEPRRFSVGRVCSGDDVAGVCC